MASLLLLFSMLSMLLISALPHSFSSFSNNHHHEQEQLLLQFRSAVSRNRTSLPDWNPMTHHLCNWTGITCHSNSHSVRDISLSQMGLDGTISPVLGNLSSLRSIDLSANYLNGTIPPQLGQLTNLWLLMLTDNQLGGEIPPALSGCRSLYSLALSYNQLHGSIPPELGLLSSLKYLYLGFNTLTGNIPPSLGNLSALVDLGLHENKLSGTIPPELGMLTDIEWLVLEGNQISGNIPSSLGNCSSLQVLVLHTNKLGGTIPPALSGCGSLYDLRLSYNQLHGSIPTELSLLTSLKYLILGFNVLTGNIPPSLGNLSALLRLNLGENDLRGTIPSSLTNLSKLNELILSENHIIGHIPWEIGTKLPNLLYLYLWKNQLSGNIPNSLGNCSRLEELSLEMNHLSGTVPLELGMLNRLTKLYLHTNQLVSDSSNTVASFLTALTNCSYLQILDMGYNNFTGTLPSSIGQLSSDLIYLELANTMISGSIPQQIVNLANLTFLGLSNNRFSGNMPSALDRLPVLEELYLHNNELEGSIPSEIGQMQHLGLLSLGHNKLSGKIPDSLCNSHQLRRLTLNHNNLSGEIPVSLEGCQKLELLDLSHNKLVGRIPGEVIASLKNLQFYLNLSWNSFKGSLPQEMSKIVMAQAMDISGNRLTGVIPVSVGDCTALEHLNLSHNAFEGPIPGSLSKLKNLQVIDLSFNNLSGQIPAGGLFPNKSVVTLLWGNPGLCGPKNYSLLPCPNHTHEKRSVHKRIVISVVGTIGFVLFFFIIGILWWRRFSRQPVSPSSSIFQRLGYPKFSYQDLVIATSGFDESNLLGVGNFGSVYKGILRNGKIIAIKALTFQNEEALKSFKRECKLLGRIRHRNLIRIISAFFYPDIKGLVLQFASNGSLEKHLHPDRDDEGICRLGFSEGFSIAVDVAHAMEYLHHDSPLQIVHCDLKPSNVLLDADMTALVTDFGISRLTTANTVDSLSTTTFGLRGSIGYIAPEYGLGGNVSIKGDVYSYGILLLEMVTRKKPSDEMFVGDMNMHKWVRLAFPERLADVVDSELLKDVSENMDDNTCIVSFVQVGLLCSAESARDRPSMRDVANALESLKTSLMGGAAASNLTATISDLLRNTNPTEGLASGSQSSTY